MTSAENKDDCGGGGRRESEWNPCECVEFYGKNVCVFMSLGACLYVCM